MRALTCATWHMRTSAVRHIYAGSITRPPPAVRRRAGYDVGGRRGPALARKEAAMAATRPPVDYGARREALRRDYLQPRAQRPGTSARGVHHLALICSDIERTIRFYTEVLGFPLVELFQNRDLASSTHFF